MTQAHHDALLMIGISIAPGAFISTMLATITAALIASFL